MMSRRELLLSGLLAAMLPPAAIAASSAGTDYPNRPREQGFDMVVGSWQGIYVPKGTPRPVQNTLFKVAHQAMKDPTVVKRLADGGVRIVTSSSPAEFRKFWESEHQRFAKAVNDANVETQ